MTIWLVQLQHHGSGYNPVNPTSQVVCACNTEEAAHKAGQILAYMYNNPSVRLEDLEAIAGCFTGMDMPYGYAVKQHEGEWI